MALLGFAAGFGIAHSQARADQKPHKVLICHGTASARNPYVLISVDASAVKGHLDGTAPGHGKNNYPDYISQDGTCSTNSSIPGDNPS